MRKKTHIIDATGKPLGRLASEIAKILIGKHRVDFVPYKDLSETVIVKNVEKIKFTGKKLEKKEYYYHTGYPGHLKSKKLKDLFKKNPKKVLEHAVYHMLPKNRLRKLRMKNLKIE